MDVQQAINVALFERFADAGIPFARPAQTVYWSSEERAVAAA
jgi:hypothetical protein